MASVRRASVVSALACLLHALACGSVGAKASSTGPSGGAGSGDAGAGGAGNGGAGNGGIGGVDPDACAAAPCAGDACELPLWPITESPAFAVADQTATDMMTGLMWQRDGTTMLSWSDANAYCETLLLDGHCDFRLPTRIELISLSDYTVKPSVNPKVFSSAGGDPSTGPFYWSSSPALPADMEPQRAWRIGAYIGLPSSAPMDTVAPIRCVRVAAAPLPFEDRYSASDTIVVDNVTARLWEREGTPDPGSYSSASAYCDTLALEGYDDWRLPTVKELFSIVDVRLYSPAIDSASFPGSGPYWTTSQVPGSVGHWGVDISTGSATSYDVVTLDKRARCVR